MNGYQETSLIASELAKLYKQGNYKKVSEKCLLSLFEHLERLIGSNHSHPDLQTILNGKRHFSERLNETDSDLCGSSALAGLEF